MRKQLPAVVFHDPRIARLRRARSGPNEVHVIAVCGVQDVRDHNYGPARANVAIAHLGPKRSGLWMSFAHAYGMSQAVATVKCYLLLPLRSTYMMCAPLWSLTATESVTRTHQPLQ